jgi:hypothetical protein
LTWHRPKGSDDQPLRLDRSSLDDGASRINGGVNPNILGALGKLAQMRNCDDVEEVVPRQLVWCLEQHPSQLCSLPLNVDTQMIGLEKQGQFKNNRAGLLY